MAKNSRRKKPQEDERAATAAAAERQREGERRGVSKPARERERRGQAFGSLSCLCALSVCGVKFRFIIGEHFPIVFKYFRVCFSFGGVA
jgi:predicted HNH restriction endonuclease